MHGAAPRRARARRELGAQTRTPPATFFLASLRLSNSGFSLSRPWRACVRMGCVGKNVYSVASPAVVPCCLLRLFLSCLLPSLFRGHFLVHASFLPPLSPGSHIAVQVRVAWRVATRSRTAGLALKSALFTSGPLPMAMEFSVALEKDLAIQGNKVHFWSMCRPDSMSFRRKKSDDEDDITLSGGGRHDRCAPRD